MFERHRRARSFDGATARLGQKGVGMFVIIGIDPAGKRLPLGAPAMSLDEAKRTAIKLFEGYKIKGRGLIHQVEIIDKTGKTVFVHANK